MTLAVNRAATCTQVSQQRARGRTIMHQQPSRDLPFARCTVFPEIPIRAPLRRCRDMRTNETAMRLGCRLEGLDLSDVGFRGLEFKAHSLTVNQNIAGVD